MLPKRWPAGPKENDKCEHFYSGRDFIGPRKFRCSSLATETVLSSETFSPVKMCAEHVGKEHVAGRIIRNPKKFPD